MYHLMKLFATILIVGTINAQDSTQVPPTPPPAIIHHPPIISQDQVPPSTELPTQFNLWLDRQNQELLSILNSLIASIYDQQKAQELISKFSQGDIDRQKTTENRINAIREFLNLSLQDVKRKKK